MGKADSRNGDVAPVFALRATPWQGRCTRLRPSGLRRGKIVAIVLLRLGGYEGQVSVVGGALMAGCARRSYLSEVGRSTEHSMMKAGKIMGIWRRRAPAYGGQLPVSYNP
jgi:hypothetical protein